MFQTYVSAAKPNIPPLENSTQEGDHETDSSALTPAVRKGPEGKDNESFLHEDVDKDSGTFQMYSCLHWLWFGRILWLMVALCEMTSESIYIPRSRNSKVAHIYIYTHACIYVYITCRSSP